MLAVDCITPTCGRRIDVELIWPQDKRAFAHMLECPDCHKLSIYSHHQLREFRAGHA